MGPTSSPVSYCKAGYRRLQVAPNKTFLGTLSAGILKDKGLKISEGVSNITTQNIHITHLNPQSIWAGDGMKLIGRDMVWIDHCHISLIGRQMIVTSSEPARRATISNCEFDGRTPWSATYNGQHYLTLLSTGTSDLITFQKNYIHHTSGRGPKVAGKSDSNVTMHVVNHFWKDDDGIA